MKNKLRILVVGLALFASSCDYVENSVSYEELKPPPNVPLILDKDKSLHESVETILKFQETLKDYIDYLEVYYVSIGRYYNADTELPQSKRRIHECAVDKEMFVDFSLPEPHPLDENAPPEVIINELLDYNERVKKEVKEYNRYMSVLKDRYKDCF